MNNDATIDSLSKHFLENLRAKLFASSSITWAQRQCSHKIWSHWAFVSERRTKAGEAIMLIIYYTKSPSAVMEALRRCDIIGRQLINLREIWGGLCRWSWRGIESGVARERSKVGHAGMREALLYHIIIVIICASVYCTREKLLINYRTRHKPIKIHYATMGGGNCVNANPSAEAYIAERSLPAAETPCDFLIQINEHSALHCKETQPFES